MPRKGYKQTEEHRKKLSELKKGKPRNGSPENWKHAESTKKLISEANKGKPSPLKGSKLSEDHVRKLSNIRKEKPNKYWLKKKRPEITGENHPNWKGGISSERCKAYYSLEYKEWRESVFKRDNYTCQLCGIRGVELNADHIKKWSLYPDLRYDVSNGQTLCTTCHKNKTAEELKQSHKNQYSSWSKLKEETIKSV